jgi:hypothetical protein
MSDILKSGTEVLIAIVGVAILAVLVSSRSNTVGVIQAAGSAFSNALGVAASPVTGAQVQLNTSYPTSQLGAYGGNPMMIN